MLQRVLSEPIFLLFTIISLFQAWRGLQLGQQIWRDWPTFRQPPLTPRKQMMAEQAAFFIGVPPGVFIHELGHALAVWLFGGQVLEFGFGFYWGYVLPLGNFTSLEDWFISLAGTLGSLFYTALLFIPLKLATTETSRYFLLRAIRFEIIFALIYYPVLTVFLSIGDWLTIYDFQETPIPSAITLVVHITLLALYWYVNRQGYFERPSHETAVAAAAFENLEAHIDNNPDIDQQLRYISALRRGNAPRLAKKQIQPLLQSHPQHPQVHFQQALLLAVGKDGLPSKSAHHFRQALKFGLDGADAAVAYLILAQDAVRREKLAEAHNQLEAGLSFIAQAPPSNETTARRGHLYYWLGRVYRQQNQYAQAQDALYHALADARAINDPEFIDFCQQQLDTLKQQSAHHVP
ncbi:MAG TPA: M50 family metallopeptidase [Anaerolineae bacterium]|nr:M50 family metallopeptidase [Anaerolineae bacterium]